MLTFQMIGFVMFMLFFGALVGDKRNVSDR